ncbi:hypothetical protein RI129_001272 [Pyrocoelia pectoralis]|uniref:Mutator-like transposase domain-containing protein n=1 Tax=Pyrocoelia pectoralis TaxID=417401 RepID=A0AAN7ZWX7_9COLE
MTLVNETRKGLYSSFLLKCRMCGKNKTITTEDLTDKTQVNLNISIILAAVSTGAGHSKLEQMAAVCNMPMMTNKTFSACHEHVADVVLQTAWKSMESAAREEAELAKNDDDIDTSDNLPYLSNIDIISIHILLSDMFQETYIIKRSDVTYLCCFKSRFLKTDIKHPDRRMQFCEWYQQMVTEDQQFVVKVM